MKSYTCCLLVLAVAALALLTGCAKKQTISVDADIYVAADGSGDYTSISAAIQEADDGDVIYVMPGTYSGGVEIEQEDITLLGAGPDKTVIDADDDYAVITLSGDEVEVSGFRLMNASSHGVYVKDGHHQIHDCLVTGNGDRGIYFSSFAGDPSASIVHCTVADNEVSGIYSPTDHQDTEIVDCIVAFNGRGIVADEDEGNMTIEYNCVYGEGEAFDRVSPGEGNITEDPMFVDREAGDYRLEPGSPCLGQADDGYNLGCF